MEPETFARYAERRVQARVIAEALANAGCVEIGLDHVAWPDDPLAAVWRTGTLRRNFQGYTTDTAEALIGLGASSIGRLPAGYVQNAVHISDYQKRVSASRLPVARGYSISSNDRLRAVIIEPIMCDRRVDLDSICGAFGAEPGQVIDLEHLETLAEDGLIERNGTVVKVRMEAYPLLRSVAAAFHAHLPQTEARHTHAI
jgi:oxygen-independent coproporphyrinogen III oxidase